MRRSSKVEQPHNTVVVSFVDGALLCRGQSRSWLCLTGGQIWVSNFPKGGRQSNLFEDHFHPLRNASNREGRYFDLYFIVSSIWKAML